MAEPTTRVVEGTPHALPMMLKAALPAVPGLGSLPGIRRHGGALPELVLTRHDVAIDAAHVAAYAEVCGFPRKDTVPLTYPHLLAFGLHMTIMTDSAFAFPAIGTVHLENSITQHRPVAVTERLQVTAAATNPPRRAPPSLRHPRPARCGGFPATSAGGTPRCRATTTRSTSTR